MAVADGYLRQGADVLQALGRADGLLYLAGPDTGGPPPFISSSGTLVCVAAAGGAEAIVDGGLVGWLVVVAGQSQLVDGPPVAVPVFAFESTFFDPGCLVEVVPITARNREVWAYERRQSRGPALPQRVVTRRPEGLRVASASAGAGGTAVFEVPAGEYWVVGEQGGVVRRVARRVP